MGRVFSHMRANVVAYVALFVALGGTGAWAVAEIGSSDIKRNAVRAKHIKDGEVLPTETDLVTFRESTDPSTYPPFTEAVGPTVAVQAKRGDLIAYQAEIKLQVLDGTACNMRVDIDGPADNDSIGGIVRSDSPTEETLYLDRDGASDGTTQRGDADTREFPVSVDGRYELSFSRGAEGVNPSCSSSGRSLWVAVLR